MTPTVKGTTPPGAADEQQAARWVRQMFGRVAPRYDLANHVLSFNIDKYWRWRTVRRVAHILERPEAVVVDLCCGTGDLMLALEARRGAPVLGSDFCHPMLEAAINKVNGRNRGSKVFESDALRLPLAGGSCDLLTVAFGFRNFANYRKGLEEMLRVIKPRGMVAILEFSTPPNPVFRNLYQFYSRHVLPRIGGLLSGAPDAYTYLPESVKKFPDAPELAVEMRQAGYRNVRFERMTGGIVALHTGEAP